MVLWLIISETRIPSRSLAAPEWPAEDPVFTVLLEETNTIHLCQQLYTSFLTSCIYQIFTNRSIHRVVQREAIIHLPADEEGGVRNQLRAWKNGGHNQLEMFIWRAY